MVFINVYLLYDMCIHAYYEYTYAHVCNRSRLSYIEPNMYIHVCI